MIDYPALSPNHSRQQFPRKLYDLLENANPAVVAWRMDGMSFYVHAPSSEIKSEASSLTGRPSPKKSRPEFLATEAYETRFV